MGQPGNAALRSVPTADPPLEGLRDDELMQLAATGMTSAYAVLVRRYNRAVRSYAARVCGAAGDDVAQEVFLKVWRERGSYEPRGRFRAYLFTVTFRASANEARRRKASALADDAPLVAVEGAPLDELLTAERQRRIHAQVAKLPEDQRRAILLRFAADLDYEEIARIVERPVATVRSRVFLGILRLKKLLGNWSGS
jgi:RNA polymerase sigma-70 factor (ECF subfamily)